MKTFIYFHSNLAQYEKTGNPNNDTLDIYRVKNNIPVRLGSVGRGYRTGLQAVIHFLTDNKHISRPPANFRPNEPRYYTNLLDLKDYAKVQIIHI